MSSTRNGDGPSTSTHRGGPGGLSGEEAISAVRVARMTAQNLYLDAKQRLNEWEPDLGAVTEEIEFNAPGPGPLNGMMLGIKNQIDVSGCKNWWGLQLQGNDGGPESRDATVVRRLRAEGATLVCTTSAPFVGAPGGVTPQTLNPRSKDRISGGSSGGSAAAVAAGLVHGALGSDSGGSIRIPAACCGVVGLQTTRGLASLTRTGGLTYSIGNVGPMAATTEDLRLILDVIAGLDPEDPYSAPFPVKHRWDGEPLSIGIPTEIVDKSLDAEVEDTFHHVVARLQEVGHQVERMSLPMTEEAMEIGPRVIGVAESGAIISDHLPDGFAGDPQLLEAVRRSRQISAPTLANAYHRAALLRSQVIRAFDEFDLLLTPTLPCRVPEAADSHIEKEIEVGGAAEPRTSALTRLVNPWNLAAVPAGSQPVAEDSQGAPISVQLVGSPGSDWKIIDVMGHVEGLFGGPWDTAAPNG